MTTDTISLIAVSVLCLMGIAGIIAGIVLEERERGKYTADPHESTDNCRN
ncbi:hypothetical protein [Guyparkeria halopsychrophila]